MSTCSTRHAPWYVIPANHKWFRNLAIARIVRETLESLNMRFPKPSVDIEAIKRKYHEIVGNAASVQAGPGDHAPQ